MMREWNLLKNQEVVNKLKIENTDNVTSNIKKKTLEEKNEWNVKIIKKYSIVNERKKTKSNEE